MAKLCIGYRTTLRVIAKQLLYEKLKTTIMLNKQNLPDCRPKSRKQLADEYGVSPRTLRRWFKRKELTLPQTLLLPKDLKVIYKKLGNPKDGNSK